MNWKKQATFLSRNCITREVGENKTPVDFYSISPRVLFKLRSLSRPLAQALSCIFEDRKKDAGSTMREFTGNDGEVTSGTETVIDAIKVEVLRERHAQREQAIDRLIEAFSSNDNYLLLLEIIWDSARGIFGNEPPTPLELQELASDDDLDVPTLIELLKHVGAANFRSLEKWSGKWGKALEDKLRAEMGDQIPTKSPIEDEERVPKKVVLEA